MASRLRRDTLTVEQEKGFVPRRKPVEMSFNFARPFRLVARAPRRCKVSAAGRFQPMSSDIAPAAHRSGQGHSRREL